MSSADIDVSFDGYASLYSSPSQPGTFTLFCTEEITGKKLCLGSRHDLEPLQCEPITEAFLSLLSYLHSEESSRRVWNSNIHLRHTATATMMVHALSSPSPQ